MKDNLPNIDLISLYGQQAFRGYKQSLSLCNTCGFYSAAIKSNYVEGQLMQASFVGFTCCYQKWQVLDPFQLPVKKDNRKFKLQFELNGGTYFKEALTGVVVDIPANHHQLLFLSRLEGSCLYRNSREVFDVHIDIDFLQEFLNSQGFAVDWLKAEDSQNHWQLFKSPLITKPEQRTLIDQLLNQRYSDKLARDVIRCKTLELIYSVFDQASDSVYEKPIKAADQALMHKLKSYIDANLEQEFHLKSLAHQFGINEFKLKVYFKILYQDTVFSYIRNARLDKAYSLLLNSQLEVKEITYLSGFKYPHHFTRCFYKRYQLLPSALRK